MISSGVLRLARAFFLTGFLLIALAPAEQPQKDPVFPCPEKLTYRVEWRLVTAGYAVVQQTRAT